MNTVTQLAIYALLISVCATEPLASTYAQYFPDPGLTQSFKDELRDYQKSQTPLFVSVCKEAQDRTAIMLFPLGSPNGTLALIVSGEVYNMSSVRIEDGLPVVYEALGGNWSYKKMQVIAHQLAAHGFRLTSARDLAAITTAQEKGLCTE